MGSNAKAEAYQADINCAMDAFFPVRTNTRKSTDPPWINSNIKRRVKQRRGIFMREGRSRKWKRMKKVTTNLISRRRKIYMDSQRMVLLQDDGERCFFKNIKSYGSKERPQPFDVRDVLVGLTNAECAERLAEHFNAISDEFDPLEPGDIPVTRDTPVKTLQPFQVAGRLRAFRKPKSMVLGGLFPKLVTKCADFLALPLTDIYNEVAATSVWPVTWKKEYLSAIPKCSVPAGLDDLRNISCTLLVLSLIHI